MGENVYEGDAGVVVRRVAAGRASGFSETQRGYAISTPPRAETADYVVLSSQEALRVAFSILASEAEVTGRGYLVRLAKQFSAKFLPAPPKRH